MKEGVVILHSHNYGKTAALAEAVMRAHAEGNKVIVCMPGALEQGIDDAVEELLREKPIPSISWTADATGLERKCDITPTPFTKTTPRQRANKGAKWYSGVRKRRREW